MTNKQKLELTWIGKDKRPKLEPRILLEDSEKSYHSAARVSDSDIFDNRLIFGDNLLALKALEQEFSGQVKCVYIDPPFNTGQAFEHYDDGLEHSLWLGLMRDRLEIIKRLMHEESLIFVHIDDNEIAYLTVLLDELFGRNNRVNIISVKMSEASGVKMAHVDKKLPKLKEFILVYKKGGNPKLDVELVPAGAWNEEYKHILTGISRDELNRVKELIALDKADLVQSQECENLLSNAKVVSLSEYFRINSIEKAKQGAFKFENAWRIIQAVGSSSVLNLANREPKKSQEIGTTLSTTGLIYLYKTDYSREAKQPRIQVIFADSNLMRNPGDFWQDIKTTGGVGQEGGVLFPNGKKPEALIKRIIGMCTNEGELVLDSFGGSGTTAAVAHKMKRNWITIELREHCHTHIIPRLKKVIDGEDNGGISNAVNWKGGGGFRYYSLAPSLLEKDKWGNWVISKEFNPSQLSQALCKLEGFTYAPSDTIFWQHGYSTETDFIYVTTQSLTSEQLQDLNDQVGPDRSLLVLCSSFKGDADRYPSLTVKKIPRAVLSKCEWGHDDYSLNVQNLPMAKEEPPEPKKTTNAKKTKAQPSLFDDNSEEG